MIEIQNLTKKFGAFTAVNDVSFSVERGEVLGFLGPNGAGKSTTMKMVTGFLPPTGGSAKVCGHDVQTDGLNVKRSLGYLPEGAPLYSDMTPAGFLRFMAEVRGLGGSEAKQRVENVVERVQLADVLHQPIETLSKGFKRRVGLAQAILHDPPVLILDEPTDGLDPNQKHEVRGLIQEMAADKCIVLSTHILEEVESACSRAIIIAQGKKVVDCTPAELEARSRYHNAVSITLRGESANNGVASDLQKIDGVASIEAGDSQEGLVNYVLFPQGGRSIVERVSEHARGANWNVDQIFVEHGRLDEVFRDLTGADAQA